MTFYRRHKQTKTHIREGRRLRSSFEAKVWDSLRKSKVEFKYEPMEYRIHYVVPSRKVSYLPDFWIPSTNIFIEVKGLLDADDRKKHLLIKEQYGERFDIRFCFWSLKTPIYPGSSTTCQMWADANGFKYCEKTIPEDWFKAESIITNDDDDLERLKLMRQNMTQEEFVRKYLESGRGLSPAKAMAEFNITRLAAVVHKLKTKHGLPIEKTIRRSFNERNYAEYRLV